MDEEDFAEIVRVIRQQLEEAAMGEIAEIDNYAEETDGERRYPSNRALAMEMLAAFERHLALRDRATYDEALANIRGVISEGERPMRAEVQIQPDVSRLIDSSDRVGLSDFADLRELRQSVRQLINNLRESRHE